MSLRDYDICCEIDRKADWREDFYALIMVAMKNADTRNQAHLRAAWPGVWAELEARYNAPKGLLPGESDAEGWRRDDEGNLRDPNGEIVRKGL